MTRGLIAVAATLMTLHAINAETVIDFEELSVFNGQPPSGNGQYFDGYGAGASDSGFTSQGVSFGTNQFGPGWSYSNANDVDSPGFHNQFAAFPGGGSVGDGSALIGSNYAIVNTGSLVAADGTPQGPPKSGGNQPESGSAAPPPPLKLQRNASHYLILGGWV